MTLFHPSALSICNVLSVYIPGCSGFNGVCCEGWQAKSVSRSSQQHCCFCQSEIKAWSRYLTWKFEKCFTWFAWHLNLFRCIWQQLCVTKYDIFWVINSINVLLIQNNYVWTWLKHCTGLVGEQGSQSWPSSMDFWGLLRERSLLFLHTGRARWGASRSSNSPGSCSRWASI